MEPAAVTPVEVEPAAMEPVAVEEVEVEGGISNIGLSGGSDIIHDATALLHKASRDLEGNVRERIMVEEALRETKLLIKLLEKKKE